MQIRVFYILFFFFGSSLAFSQNLLEGLVAHYTLDCNARDTSGNGFHGIMVGNASCTFGYGDYTEKTPDMAYNFTGRTGNIEIPTTSSSSFISANGFSWSAWVYLSPITTGIDRHQTIISVADNRLATDVYLGLGSEYSSNSELTFFVDGAGGSGASAQASNAVLKSQISTGWHHVLGVRNYPKDSVYLYLDGNLVASAKFAGTPILDNNMKVSIGGFWDNDKWNKLTNGQLDDVRIYSRALSSSEAKELSDYFPSNLSSNLSVVEFGNINCQSEALIPIKLKNNGDIDLEITQTLLSQNSNFSVVNGGEIKIEPNQEFELFIQYKPNTTGIHYDTLHLPNKDELNKRFPLIIPINGSLIELEQDTLIFPITEICGNEVINISQSIDLKNYLSGVDLAIEGIAFTQSNFTHNMKPLDILEKNIPNIYQFNFSANDTGRYETKFTLKFSNCVQSKSIVVIAQVVRPDFIADSEINFGDKAIGFLSTTTTTITYMGSSDVEFISIENVNYPFSRIVQTQLANGDKINRLDNIEVEVSYTAAAGLSRDTLVLKYNSLCGNKEVKIPLVGNGLYTAEFKIEPKNIVIDEIGKLYKMAVKLLDSKYIDSAGITEINFNIKYNPRIIYRDNSLSSTFTDDYLIENITLNNLNNPNNEYELFDVKGLLGEKYIDSIYISDVVCNGGLFDVSSANGTVEISDLCREGGERLFDSRYIINISAQFIAQISAIQFNMMLIEKGNNKLQIFDIFGRQIDTYNFESMPNELKILELPVNSYSNGIYFYTITTPSQLINGKIMVGK